MRPAFKYHGGKGRFAKKIVALFPVHDTYVEPFAGALNVLLNKPRTSREIVGDLDGDLINFYRVLRDRPDELVGRVNRLEYREDVFDWARVPIGSTDPVDGAVRRLVRQQFSRGSLGKGFAWSDRPRGGRPGDLNAWEKRKTENILPRISARLRGVELHHGDAVDLIERFDGPETLFYLDPPYVQAARTTRDAYQHEMSDEDHIRLLDVIVSLRGMVVLSGYHNPLYDHALRFWERHEFERPNDSGQTKVKSRRVEVLWMSPGCDRFQLRG
jgi:DNA adenine methylase